MWGQSLIWKYPLEKEMATHFCYCVWEIPWTEEPSRLQSPGSQRIKLNLVAEEQQGGWSVCVCVCVCVCFKWRVTRKTKYGKDCFHIYNPASCIYVRAYSGVSYSLMWSRIKLHGLLWFESYLFRSECYLR